MAAVKTYFSGTQVRLTGTFKDAAGNLVDPSTVSAKALYPTKDLTFDLDVARLSLGVWTGVFTPTETGLYYYRFVGAGSVPVVNEGSFFVQSSF